MSDSTGVTHSPIVLVFPSGTLQTNLSWCSFGSPKTRYVPTGSQIASVWERPSSGIEVEVKAKASWRLTRSDCGEP
ncbi:hypothetical protein E5676_scaffold303G00010 [Cucumis melo var. makuwa]|uniref:Uncharacterized protein n=1 Tax=Cucumis melo var. makuwa TaxID=1194695 RepID=A0A5A7TUT8_CUCMM|nr:hypothetical protein E6C27_scaffold243G001020 [Cucumis melo var. makuwa]TYK28800.1 hypothetical protein E5676_scaffold303G00010 [Cucumis melo var. makuwa]